MRARHRARMAGAAQELLCAVRGPSDVHEVPTRLERAIEAGGEAGALVRSLALEQTGLGPMAAWPSTLVAAVSTCLTTGFPMVINWGKRLLQIYNDAALPVFAEKHPQAMGRSARTNFP